MNERKLNLIVGITALAAVVGIGWMLLRFGAIPHWFEHRYVVTVAMQQTGGLSEGSRVRIHGVDIGYIEKVGLRPDLEDGVAIRARINQDIRIPREVDAAVPQTLLGGNPALQLSVPPDANGADHLPIDGSAVIQGRISSPVEGLLNGASGMVDGLTKDLGARFDVLEEKFTRLLRDFEKLSTAWTSVGNNINSLVEPREVTEVDAGREVGNLATLVARTDAGVGELRATIDHLNTWLGDETLRADVKATASNVRKASAGLASTVDSTAPQIDGLLKRYVAVADDLAGVVGQARAILGKVDKGDGTMAELINNPSVYNNLDDAVQRLSKTLEELQLLIEKWKAEGLPVQF